VLFRSYSAIEYAKEKAANMVKDAWEGIDKILPESESKEKLKAFAYYLIERKI
jgi:geranylgeranyl pyrophosphate synthase